jgi:RHS repeat-associated protein
MKMLLDYEDNVGDRRIGLSGQDFRAETQRRGEGVGKASVANFGRPRKRNRQPTWKLGIGGRSKFGQFLPLLCASASPRETKESCALPYKGTAKRSEFTYDGFGRRVRIVEKDGATVTSDSRFVWDGLRLAQRWSGGGGTMDRQYFEHGFMVFGGKYYYIKDHLGTVWGLYGQNGAPHGRWRFTLYGERGNNEVTNLPMNSDMGFTGHYQHVPSGLVLAPYRAYDPETARWLSRDPLGEFADGPNLYSYVLNNPVNLWDPDGLDAVPAPGGGYNFVVRPGLNLKNLAGSSITHPNDRFSGQCATGAQFLTGTNVNGRIHDAPSTRTWRPGEPVGKGMRPGTMVATGWDNGRYPSAPPSDYRQGGPREGQTVNHAGIFMGTNRDGSINLFDQAAGLTLRVRRHDAEGYRAVVSGQKYDPSASSCGATARPAR